MPRPAHTPRAIRRFVLALALALASIALFTGGFEALLGTLMPRPAAGAMGVPNVYADAALQAKLTESASVTAGRLAFAVQDLRSGAYAGRDADRAQQAASLFKLPIVVEAERRIADGRLSPETELEIRPEHWTGGSGVLQAQIGSRVPVRELLRLTVEESDNVAALVLLDALDANDVNASMRSLGLANTLLRDRQRGEGGQHLTSAGDTLRLLTLLAAGQIGGTEASEASIRLLELPQAQRWLASDLPRWAKIAHKWGAIPPDSLHDAGLVYTPRASFAVVVMTEGVPPAEAAKVIGRIAHTAYETLSTRENRGPD